MNTDGAVQCRTMRTDDLRAVVALEESSQFTPWSETNFRDALAAGNLCLVATRGAGVAAMAVVQLAAGNAELLTMAVAPELRRGGIGRRMLDEAIVRVAERGAEAMWLEVRVSNAPAIALYRSAGFAAIGWRRNYYRTATGREDAMMMRLSIAAQRKEA